MVRISRNRENVTAIESTTTTMANLILYHGVRLVVKSRKEFTVIELHNKDNIYSISRGFSRGL